MSIPTLPCLNNTDILQLNTSLLYCNNAELKELCSKIQLPSKGKKIELIAHIVSYIKTGTITTPPPIPKNAKAEQRKSYPLSLHTPLLYGNYKNDRKTRNFLKTLIGPHFHYTAYGIDWINKQWQEGKAPTYQEFATYWSEEYKRRKSKPEPPKPEWAYINFVQNYLKVHPQSSRAMLTEEWNKARQHHVQQAYAIIDKYVHRVPIKNTENEHGKKFII